MASERQYGGVANVVGELRTVLSVEEVARACGVGPRQVQRWSSGVNAPAGKRRDCLLDLLLVVRGLSEVYTSEGVHIFLHGRQHDLGGVRPLEAFAGGRGDEVVRIVERLRAGAM